MPARLTGQIKGDPKLAMTPVIAVSSFAVEGDKEKAHVAGCDLYVTEPYRLMHLLRVISGYLGDRFEVCFLGLIIGSTPRTVNGRIGSNPGPGATRPRRSKCV
jgi:hypothetical protein